ncbi:hypothetical protein [Nocardia sp. X0981]
MFPAGTGQFEAQQFGAALVGRHPHRQFAARRMREQEHARAARGAVQ